MGNDLDTCICCKDLDDINIEVEIKSGEKHKVKILKKSNNFSIKGKRRASLISKLSNKSNNMNTDSIFSEKKDINNKNRPEILIQSRFRAYIYRKKFYNIDGIKQELITKNNEIINQVEKNFIHKSILKSEKLFINSSFEENWKYYYYEDDYLLKNNNINNKNIFFIKIDCLLSKYKNTESLYKGTADINSIKINKFNKSYIISFLTGKGILYLKNGKKYEGTFINGELNGWCRFIDSNGICYEGLFISGILNGKGEILKIDESRRKNIYKGDIKIFKKEGKGIEKTNDYTYEGDFLNDLKQGKGKIKYNITGDYYEGDFKKGALTGKGYYIWKNKNTYLGDFVDGKMHGKGLYKWPDGNEYEGEYINNIKEGDGIFRWKDGRIYKGNFENGKPHGKGKLTVNGISFNALFENGKFLGEIQND